MKKILSVVAVAATMSSSVVASELGEALKGGAVNADVTVYAEQQNNSGANPDSGYINGSLGLGYETGEYKGFKLSAGFRANSDFHEVEDGDFGGDDTKALLHTANISYANKYVELTLGRQEIDLEWMGDFHEAYIAAFKPMEGLSIVAGYSDKSAVADPDAELEDFTKFNGSDGAYVLDVKYEAMEGLGLNAYYYSANNIADWYGAKVDYDTDMFEATAHYANSSEDAAGADDGSILHVEARGSIQDFGLNVGYITTDNDAGIGSMDAMGDNISPFEEGNQVYAANSDTYYIGASYAIAGVELGALYGQSKYGATGDKEKELNFSVDYGVTEEISIGAVFVDVDAQASADDYNKIAFTAAYTF